MRTIRRGFAATMLLVLGAAWVPLARAVPYDELPAGKRAQYTAQAVAANSLPIASSLVEPKCLPPYPLCKFTFAFISVLGAAETLVMSGGADRDQPRAILYRGFAGDWFVTPRSIGGGARPQVLPEAPPAEGGASGTFVPPPR